MTRPKITAALVALLRAGVTERSPGADSLPHLDQTDWEELLRLTLRHEVAPLLYHGASIIGVPLPERVADVLRHQARVYEIRCDRAWDQLHTVLVTFNEHGLEPVILKGALFAIQYYRSPGLRPFSDVDILLPLQFREQAASLLAQLGYPYKPPPAGHDQDYLAERDYHWAFRLEHEWVLELHWSLAPPSSGVRINIDELWARTERLRCPGGYARTLALEDQLTYLATHVTKHQFRVPLRHYVDLAAILEAVPSPDWEKIWQRASEIGAENDLAAFIGVAHQLKLVSLPPALMERAAVILSSQLHCASLARYAVDWHDFDHPHGIIETFAAPSPQAALRTIWAAFFPSTRELAAGTEIHHTPQAGESTYPALWQKRVRRLLQRQSRLREELPHIRAAISIRRLFQDRDTP